MPKIFETRSAPAAVFAAGVFLYPACALTHDIEPPQEGQLLEQIVVVAHKDERSVRDIAAHVTVLTRADLNNDLATSISDVFRYVPGVDHEAAGSRFGTEGINIRGIGGNRVAIVVDGVPLSDHFSVGSFSNATRDFIDAGLIETIEVLHGPASALYGSSTIGGVVAVKTPDPADLAGARQHGGDALATWHGADTSVQGQTMFALGDRVLGFVAGLSLRTAHELESAAVPDSLDQRESNRRTATVKFVADDRRGNTWRAGYIQQDSRTVSDLNSMLGSGRYRSTTALDGDDHYRMSLFNIAYEFEPARGLIDSGVARGYLQATDIEQKTLDERGNAGTPESIDRFFAFEQKIRGLELNAWRDFETEGVAHRLGFGLEVRERRTEEFRDGLSTDMQTGEQSHVLLGEVFPLRDFPISTTIETGAYVEDTMNWGDWTIIAALRADRFELSPTQDAMYREDYPFAEPVSISESDLSPKLGIIYDLTPTTDVYLQYSHGFRAPPYADANISLDVPLFNFRAVPNPDLKSESSDGFDFGVRWRGADSSLRLAFFHTRYEDFIESRVRLGIDPDSGRLLFQSQNLAATRIEGIEAGWSVRWQALGFDGSAYYARGVNKESGEPLNSVGPAQIVIGFSWFSTGGRSQLRLKTTLTDSWSERDETSGELFKPAGHAVVDLFVTQRLGAHATLRAGLHNLTDRTYWNWSDVRGLSLNDPVLPHLARAGRSASVSLNVSW